MPAAVNTSAWRSLSRLAESCQNSSVANAFSNDPHREDQLSFEATGIYLDLSHQNINTSFVDTWSDVWDEIDLRAAIRAMWAGEHLNTTEDRAVLHAALRQNPGDGVGGLEIERLVLTERARMLRFAKSVRASGRYRLVVNIGIGGSDLGPALVCSALHEPSQHGPKVVFVSNVDGCALADVLAGADPEHTLFIVCSKTFTTQETMANAGWARDWVIEQLGAAAVREHFVAVSTNAAAMDAFGIAPEHRFCLWDWVGGRYSLWSSIGLSIAISAGEQAFVALLAGARAMDQHFHSAPWSQNLPVLLAAVGVWNTQFLGLVAHAVLPYSDRLSLLPAYLQQLEMESNGKSVSLEATSVAEVTCPIIWGASANNAQHSFFQLLHQGALLSSMDFILIKKAPAGALGHPLSLSNALAQIEAFSMGFETSNPHRRHRGGRPLSVLTLDALTPFGLGSLLALYEHKVFAQSRVWGINAFDQFGVELGKSIAKMVAPALTGDAAVPSLHSVQQLLARLKA